MNYRLRQFLSVLSVAVLLAPFLQFSSAFADSSIGLNVYNVNNLNTDVDIAAAGTSFAVGPDGNFWYNNGGPSSQTSVCSTSLQAVVGNTGDSNCYTAAQTRAGGSIGQIISGPDGNVWLLNERGIMQMTTSGTVLANYTPGGGSAVPIDITSGPGGDVWFIAANYSAGITEIGNITPAGVMTEYDLPSGVQPRQITSGPNGNVWFTAYDQNTAQGVIGETDTSGNTTIYNVPYFNSSANESDLVQEITAGPDGNVWFAAITRVSTGSAEVMTWYMNSITPSGTVTAYQLPVQENLPWSNDASSDIDNTNVFSITAGPDGNIWYTFWDQTEGQSGIDYGTIGTSYVGEVTPTGTVTQYTTPYDGTLYKIIAGPDGNMWAEGQDPSTSQSQLVQVVSTPPAAPTNLTAATPTEAPVLNWTASQDATYYNIYRNGTLIDTISANNTSYTDTPPAEGNYSYDVTAVNGSGESGPSNAVSVDCDPVPANYTLVNLTDSNGNPLSDAKVTLQDAQGDTTTVTTDGFGNATANTAPGTYKATVYYANGFESQSITTTASGPNVLSFSTVPVTVTINDPSSADLSNAYVAQAGNTGTFGAKQPVNSSGQVTFQVLTGTSTFTAYDANGNARQSLTVSPTNNAVTFNTDQVVVTVTKNGNQLSTALVTQAGNTGTFGAKQPVNSSGQYTYNVLPGTNYFEAFDGTNAVKQELTVTGNTSLTLAVQ